MKAPPDNILRRMSAADRKKHFPGTAGMTAEECAQKFASGEESKLQNLISNYMLLHNIYFVRSRMDRKTQTRVGVPDFLLTYKGRFIALEAKCGTNKPSQAQDAEMARITASGGIAEVVRCLQDVQAVLRRVDAEVSVIQDALRSGGWSAKQMPPGE